MWAVDEADRLWRRTKRHWEQPSPDMRARRVAVGSNDTVWCLDAGGETFLALVALSAVTTRPSPSW
jgi:hypothetical protein